MTGPVESSVRSLVHVAPGNGPRLYGGALMAALLRAAGPLAHVGARPHTSHVHFLDAGSPAAAVDLAARVLQATRSFSRIEVTASQGGRSLAAAVLSFASPRPGRSHQIRPIWPTSSPEDAEPAAGGPIPPTDAPSRRGFDLRRVDEDDVRSEHGAGAEPTADGRPVLRYWVRSRSSAGGAAELMAASDLCLTRVADLEHEGSPGRRRAASLDQATWFHREVDLTAWHLYEVSSPAYADGLALSTGRFFDPAGHLVATVAQTSLLLRTTESGVGQQGHRHL